MKDPFVLDRTCYEILAEKGFQFYKTFQKKNPPKSDLETKIISSYDELSHWRMSSRGASIKARIPRGFVVLDFDNHQEDAILEKQFHVLEMFLKERGFLYDKTPQGLHVVLADQGNASKFVVRASKMTSIGLRAEIFPSAKLINFYDLSGNRIPDIGIDFKIDFLSLSHTRLMKVAEVGERHNELRDGLLAHGTDPSMHRCSIISGQRHRSITMSSMRFPLGFRTL